jgi:hypothetical protein
LQSHRRHEQCAAGKNVIDMRASIPPLRVLFLLAYLALTACDKKQEPPSRPASSASSTPTLDLRATKIAVPLKDATLEDLTQALEKGGWTVSANTQAHSAVRALSAKARKGGVEAELEYYYPTDRFWRSRLEKKGAVIYDEGQVLIGVVVERNNPAAQKLLDSLVGRP